MKFLTTPSNVSGRWLGYSGLAAAFLAVATKTSAQVVSVDIDPDAVLTGDTLDIDFDGDDVVDISIMQGAHMIFTSFSVEFAAVSVPTGNAVLGSTSSGYMYPNVLATGAPIAPGDGNFKTSSFGSLFYNGFNGFWGGQTGFLGCRFVAGDGQTHYGWVQLSVNDDGTTTTVMAYGYESTPDQAINAGDLGMTTGIGNAMVHSFPMDITPNPTSDNAVIHFPNTGSGHMRMSVLNSVGETFLNEEMGNADSYTLNLAGYAPGVYFVRLQDDKKVAFRKVVKQ